MRRKQTSLRRFSYTGALIAFHCASVPAAEDLEFVAEHLPEVSMDNRYATLPWADDAGYVLQGGYTSIRSGSLKLEGPELSFSIDRAFGTRWHWTALAFYDRQQFSGSSEQPFAVFFTRDAPLSLPATAHFDALEGRDEHYGFGGMLHRRFDWPWLGNVDLAFGALAESVRLRGYRSAYRVLTGASTGATGTIDYSETYRYITPIASLSKRSAHPVWNWSPRLTLAMPLPRQPWHGAISGPGFAVSGDTARIGNGKHMGDVDLSLGLDVIYEPWHLSVDLGSALTQALFEPKVHKGVDENWIAAVKIAF
jgi:hypothetical protein